MTERQGHWIVALSKEKLEEKVNELNEYLFDVILEKNSIKSTLLFCGSFCPRCYQRTPIEGIKGYVHYII